MKKRVMVLLLLIMPILIISFVSVKPAYAVIANIYVDPPSIVDPTKSPGSTFSVNISITDVSFLYSWQITIMYNWALLNVTGVTFGNFFDGHPNIPQYSINNDEGWVMAGQTLIGFDDYVSGSGWLFQIDFLVEAYGGTTLAFDLAGVFRPTFLLDYTLRDIPFTATDGYFRNGAFANGPGDANGDGVVDIFDIGALSAHWYPGPPVGILGYDPAFDTNNDGSIDIFDIGIVSANWGNTYT